MEVTSRFKELEQVECLKNYGWRFMTIVQEAVTKTIPKKKRCKKSKWLSEEALRVAEERREVKGKRKSERYTQLNVEFQKISGEKRKPS